MAKCMQHAEKAVRRGFCLRQTPFRKASVPSGSAALWVVQASKWRRLVGDVDPFPTLLGWQKHPHMATGQTQPRRSSVPSTAARPSGGVCVSHSAGKHRPSVEATNYSSWDGLCEGKQEGPGRTRGPGKLSPHTPFWGSWGRGYNWAARACPRCALNTLT